MTPSCCRFVRRYALATVLIAGALLPTLAQENGSTNSAQNTTNRNAQVEDLSRAVGESRNQNGGGSNATVKLDPKWMEVMPWRSIGPAGMGGRVVDFAVVDSDPSTYWVATAGGGLLKTTNNGVTFEHQFDHEGSVCIGSVCVAPSDPNIVWVGTGENNPRNSVSYGDGVYKSTNGGTTWKKMGLPKSFQIGRIAIHRKNPNVVYVGALGRLYGPNEERGLYKTADGGETWERILYVDDKTGVIDVQMHPTDSDTLLVATWERLRDGYDSHPGDPPMEDGYDRYDPIKKWGPGGAIWKTTNGGKNWKKLTKGLPTSNLGRIGIDYYRKDPKTVFAIIDCEDIGKGEPLVDIDITGVTAEGGVRLTTVRENGPSAQGGLKVDDIVKSVGDKTITEAPQLTEELRAHRIGDSVKIKVQRGDETQEVTVTLQRPPDPATNGPYLGLNGDEGENGVKVTTVADNSPASQAEIRVGDVVTSVNDQLVTGTEQITEALSAKNPGDKVQVKILRDGQSQEIEVTLAARPQGGAAGAPRGRRGGNLTAQDVAAAPTAQPGRGGRGGGGAVAGGRGGSRTRPSGANLGGQMENVQDQQGTNGHLYGGIYKSTDGGESWTRINSYNPRPMYFSLLKVDPSDDRFLYVGGVNVYRSTNYGKTFRGDAGRNVHADQHAMWIDPRDGRHMLIGCDGGFYASYDRSVNWDHLNTMDIGQFYNVAISTRQPYYVAGGLQDNGSWFGPSQSLSGGGPINEDWLNVGGGDGFVCKVDPNDPDLVYSESQDGSVSRRNLRTGERGTIRPTPPGGGGRGGARGRGRGAAPANAGGEGGENADATPPAPAPARGGGGQGGNPAYRFNWNTPFILSAANSRIFYMAGDYVFRSLDRGNDLRIISPQIPLTSHGSATALAESPRNPDVLYAGTDDGALWVTRDGGKSWTNIWKNVGLPGPRWVASIEASRFVEGRAYVAFDCHRSDEDDPSIYVTEDFGVTWKSIRANLPWGSTRVLREDIQNQNLLFVGTEVGAFCSLDRGNYWNRFGTNFPTVAVHEFAFHPSNGEVVAATHGRSLWVLDASALRQIQPENLESKNALYKPADVIRWRGESQRGTTNRKFVGQNPPGGAAIYYSLAAKADAVTLKIIDINGTTVREYPGKKDPGLYLQRWDMGNGAGGRGRGAGGAARGGGAQVAAAGGANRRGGAGAGGGGGRGFGGRGGTVPAGTYRVVLTVDGQDLSQTIRIEPDPVAPAAPTVDEVRAMEAAEEEEEQKNDNGGAEQDSQREMDIQDRDFDLHDSK